MQEQEPAEVEQVVEAVPVDEADIQRVTEQAEAAEEDIAWEEYSGNPSEAGEVGEDGTPKRKYRTLTHEQKIFIIVRFACFVDQSQIREDYKERFGEEIGYTHVRRFDFDARDLDPSAPKIPLNQRKIFDEVREKYIKAVSAVPIMVQRYRGEAYQRLYERNKDKSPAIVLDILEQAAKDSGGLYTNKRDVTTGGQQIQQVIGYTIIPPAAPSIQPPIVAIEALNSAATGDAQLFPDSAAAQSHIGDAEMEDEFENPFIEH